MTLTVLGGGGLAKFLVRMSPELDLFSHGETKVWVQGRRAEVTCPPLHTHQGTQYARDATRDVNPHHLGKVFFLFLFCSLGASHRVSPALQV